MNIEERCSVLDNDLKESRYECEDLRSRLESEQARVTELTREHQDKNARIQTMEKEVEELRSRLMSGVQLESQWKVREDEWSTRGQKLENQLETARHQIATFKW